MRDQREKLFIVYVLLTFLTLVSANVPSIEKVIEKETKASGQLGMLNCTVTNKGTYELAWVKIKEDGENLMISTDTKIKAPNPDETSGLEKYEILVTRFSDVKVMYTLAIRSLQEDDTGTYECYVILRGEPPSNYPRARGELVVQLPPSISDSQVTTTVQVAVGETARLRCDASGVPEPRISWSRANGMPLANGATTSYGKELVIYNATHFDRGTYRCKAENNVKPPGLIDVTLDVFYKPFVVPFRKSVGQQPGRNYEVRLSCRVSGNPEPVARWLRVQGNKREELFDSFKYRVDKLRWLPGSDMKVGEYWYELTIRIVNALDAGPYLCSASNTYGTSSATVTLFMTTTCQTWKCWAYTAVNSAPAVVVSMVTVLTTVVIATWYSIRQQY